ENPENGRTYRVVCIFTDKPASNAQALAKQFSVAYEENDLAAFYRKKGKPKSDLSVRGEFDQVTVEKLSRHAPDVLAYAGYMAIASPTLVNAFLGINVHPADLAVLDENGKRKYVGAHAVRDAILAGEKKLRATTHVVSNVVDGGPVLMRSKPVPVRRLPKGFDPKNREQLNRVAQEHQERLKRQGDFVIFPETLKKLAKGTLFAKPRQT
ncbi:MAG: formyltransferase family protein, partial [Candidatus Micrarchaeota archaeon]|nr:formyltransferase family protein [Candidatus Micrarchaeota archaeon]